MLSSKKVIAQIMSSQYPITVVISKALNVLYSLQYMEAQQGCNLNMKWYLLMLSRTITIDVCEIYSYPCPCVLESISCYKSVYIMSDGHR